MIPYEKREQAFQMFLAGHGIRSIAAQIGVCRSTVERWSVKLGWVEQRTVTWHQRKRKALEDHIAKSKHLSMALSDFVFDQLMDEIGWYKSIQSGAVPAKARKFRPRRIQQLANTLVSANYGEAVYSLLRCNQMDQSIREQLSEYVESRGMKKKAGAI